MSKVPFRIKFKSFSLIEVVFAISLFSVFLTIIIGSLVYAQDSMEDFGKHSRAILLAEEGQEAARAIKNNDFTELTDGSHSLISNTGKWQFASGEETIDSFKRTVAVSTVDEFTKKIDVNVSWPTRTGRTDSFALSSFLSNWNVITETGIDGFGDWTEPYIESSLALTGGKDGLKVQVSGNYCYLVRDSAAQSLVTVDVSNPANPVLKSEYNLQNNPKNLYIHNNLALIASSSNTSELQIIDMTDPSAPVARGMYDAPGAADALGITARDNYAYLTKLKGSDGAEFFIVDISNPDSPTQVGSLELNRNGNDVALMDNYAYIASGPNGKQLTVVDISNPASPTEVGSYSMILSQNALTVSAYEKTVFIGSELGVMYVLDVTNPASPQSKSLFLLRDGLLKPIRDLAFGLNNHYLFMASDAATREFQVLNISTVYPPPFWRYLFSAPAFVSSVDTPVSLSGVAYSNELDRAFVVGKTNEKALMIIAPKLVQE